VIAQRASRFLASGLNRMVLAYGVALLLAFVAIGGLSLLAYDHLVDRDVRRTVRAEHEDLREIHRDGGLAALSRAIDVRVDEDTRREAVYLLADARGRVLAGHLADLPPGATRARGWIRFAWNADGDEAVAYVERLADGAVLLTGHTTGEQQRVRELLLPLGLSIFLLLAALTLLLGWLLRRSLAHNLQATLDTVDRFAAGRLDERIPVGPGDDPLQRLARTLDRMLDRIRDLVGGIQASTDHIAHDLRTPLTRLRSRLEGLRMETLDEEQAIALDAAVGEVDQLLSSSNALLRLARVQSQPRVDDDPLVALDRIARDAIDLYEPIAVERGIRMDATSIGPVSVRGDADQLFQATANLLDNAIKYSPGDGAVGVVVQASMTEAIIVVSDEGEGIPIAERARVFDRYYRLERHRRSPGTGLGLSLVQAVVHRHGGQIHLDDHRPGLRVTVRLPLSGEAGVVDPVTDPP